MELHPVHRVYLGVGGAESPTAAARDLHPLHRVYLGIDPGEAATPSAGSHGGKQASPSGFARAAAGLLAAAVVAQVGTEAVGGK